MGYSIRYEGARRCLGPGRRTRNFAQRGWVEIEDVAPLTVSHVRNGVLRSETLRWISADYQPPEKIGDRLGTGSSQL